MSCGREGRCIGKAVCRGSLAAGPFLGPARARSGARRAGGEGPRPGLPPAALRGHSLGPGAGRLSGPGSRARAAAARGWEWGRPAGLQGPGGLPAGLGCARAGLSGRPCVGSVGTPLRPFSKTTASAGSQNWRVLS